ncbi:hypothetical protein GOV07_05070 [Candidatus Woesearchaeota archaeon]|nr:hypothetical protein [Candidatus Woesearchaeota archaeon]
MRYAFLILILLIPFVAAENNSQNNSISRVNCSLASLLSERLYTGVTYEKLFKVKNEQYTKGMDAIDVTVAYNLSRNDTLLWNRSFTVAIKSWKTAGTGELRVNETGNYTLCGRVSGDSVCQVFIAIDPALEPCNITLSLELKEPKLYYENGETIKFWNRLDAGDSPFSIRYWIEDLDGELQKLTLTENTNQKRWTPHTNKEFDVFLLKNEIELLACNNTNNKTSDERLIVVKGEKREPVYESNIEIKLSEPKNGYEFGDEVKARIILYKGNTSKYSVKAFVEDVHGKKVSSTATMYAKKKYTDYDVTLPILLDEREGSGKHTVVIEGLGISASEKIWVKGKESEEHQEQIVEEEKETVIITSFYTRNTKPKDEINLYANIKGNGNVEVELVGLLDYQENKIELENSYKYKTAVSMQEGPNVFLLKVKDDDVLTQQVLLLEMTDEIRKVEKFTHQPTPQPPTPTTEEKEEEIEKEQRPDSNFITGAAYDADTTTVAVPVLLGIMGALLLGLILHKR